MPSVSEKQARTMAWAAHDKDAAKKLGIPQSVAKEFNQEDKGTGIIKPKMDAKTHGEIVRRAKKVTGRLKKK